MDRPIVTYPKDLYHRCLAAGKRWAGASGDINLFMKVWKSGFHAGFAEARRQIRTTQTPETPATPENPHQLDGPLP